MNKTALIPLSNLYARGAFSAPLRLGQEQKNCHFVLDSGSSTLVVDGKYYQPDRDQLCCYMPLVQEVFYGMGGWFGPVVKTQVIAGHKHHQITLDNAHLAVTTKAIPKTFGEAHGMLGLAYSELNHAFEFTSLLAEHNFESDDGESCYQHAKHLTQDLVGTRSILHNLPQRNLLPYFNQLENAGHITHQFAFSVHRSSIYQSHNRLLTASHPLNTGLFILGSPKPHSYLHKDNFQAVKVLHDKYYNVSVLSLQVGNSSPRPAPELLPNHVKAHVSNGIIDTGATHIVLPETLFLQLCDDLIEYNPNFRHLIAPFKQFNGTEKGIDKELINWQEWPDILITLDGFDNQTVTLTLSPHVYWQVHAPSHQQASFKFTFLANWPNQCILGLPLFCDHFTIFDRHEHQTGAVIFANKAISSEDWHLHHHDHEKMGEWFRQLRFLI